MAVYVIDNRHGHYVVVSDDLDDRPSDVADKVKATCTQRSVSEVYVAGDPTTPIWRSALAGIATFLVDGTRPQSLKKTKLPDRIRSLMAAEAR